MLVSNPYRLKHKDFSKTQCSLMAFNPESQLLLLLKSVDIWSLIKVRHEFP